jgi:hypothetical protein
MRLAATATAENDASTAVIPVSGTRRSKFPMNSWASGRIGVIWPEAMKSFKKRSIGTAST